MRRDDASIEPGDRLQVLTPPADLSPAVEAAVWLRRTAPGSVTHFPAMPRAMLTVQWPLGASAPGADPAPVVFHTLSTRPTCHRSDGPFVAVGLVLHPAAAAGLLCASTGATVDQVLPWARIAGDAEARRLDGELQQARHDAARVQALLDSFRRLCRSRSERNHTRRVGSVARLVQLVGQHGLQAAPLLALSERQLERRCQALLALSPKALQRLVRLRRVLGQAVQRRAPLDAQGALEAGYFDQSHLAREVRQLAGAPLRQLLAESNDRGAWWPLATRQRLAAAAPD